MSDILSFVQGVPQIVPESWCLNCRICCRFPSPEGVQSPTWSSPEADWAKSAGAKESWFRRDISSGSFFPHLPSCDQGFRCPAFDLKANRCSIYAVRPLDCRLYPFVLSQDLSGEKITLNMDTKCPFLQHHGSDPEISAYALRLARYLEGPMGLKYLKENPHVVGTSWPEFIPMAALPSFRRIKKQNPTPPHPSLRPLTFSEKGMLLQALQSQGHAHSGYSLAGIFGWMDLIRFWWTWVEGALCLFAEQAGGLFMPVPPFGEPTLRLLRRVWEIVTEANQGRGVSRIEGVEPRGKRIFKERGFRLLPGEPEYLYRRDDLVSLRGNRYHSHRGDIHRARKKIPSLRIRPFEVKDLVPCLQLYTRWGICRQREDPEGFEKNLFRDGLFFHRRLMMSYRQLNLQGRVLEAEGKIRGYTFGGLISKKIFCIFLEITDRSTPGLNALLFQEFCRQMETYPLINTMGDEGIPGLRRAKIGYRPVGMVKVYSASLTT